MKMKAAMYHGKSRTLNVEDVPIPELQAREVLIRVAACGVCHTDLHYLDHGVPTAKAPPLILGHEISGTIDRMGEGTATPALEVGMNVLLPAVLTCGVCPLCRQGRENICEAMQMLGNHIDGGYAQYVKAPAKDVIPLNKAMNLEESAIIADAVSTPYHAVVNRAQVRPGETVAVVGCGGVGLNVVQVAAALGARVFALDALPEKSERAKTLGAVQALALPRPPANPPKPLDEVQPQDVFSLYSDVIKQMRRLTQGGVDCAFEVVGKPETIGLAFHLLRPGGRLCQVGYTDQNVSLPLGKVMFRELQIIGSLGCRPSDYPRIVDLVGRGKLQLKPLISHRLPLEEINAAFDLLREGKALRILIVP